MLIQAVVCSACVLHIPGSALLHEMYWSVLFCRLTWSRSAYCFCTSGMEVDTFRSASRSFFRLALASEWMISTLILKGAERRDRWGHQAEPSLRLHRPLTHPATGPGSLTLFTLQGPGASQSRGGPVCLGACSSDTQPVLSRCWSFIVRSGPVSYRAYLGALAKLLGPLPLLPD